MMRLLRLVALVSIFMPCFVSSNAWTQPEAVSGYDATILVGSAYLYHVAMMEQGDVYVRRCHLSSGPSWTSPARCIGNYWGGIQHGTINQLWVIDYNSHVYLFVRAGDSNFYFRSFYDAELNRIAWAEECTFLGNFWDGLVFTKSSSWSNQKGQFKSR